VTRSQKLLEAAVGAACCYEAAAVAVRLAGRDVLPTISHEVGVWPWIGLLIIGGLSAHFYWPHIAKLHPNQRRSIL
jgi:hypothetical protein